METNEPAKELVSVIVPAYNAERWIASTLASALAQTYRNLEVIVVDDGSTDGTHSVVETFAACDPRLRLLRQTNAGPVGARNAGIAASRGTFIAPLDADDLWHPEKIAKQVALMHRSGAKVGVVYSWFSIIDENARVTSRALRPCLEGDVYIDLILSCFISTGSVPLIRRSCVEEVGGYRANVDGCEDLKLYLDIAERYQFVYVPEFLAGYRQSRGSVSQNLRNMTRSYERVIAEVRERHPELPSWLFRHGRTDFRYWFGLNSLRYGRINEGAALLAQIALTDPLFLLRPLFRQSLFRALRKFSRALGFSEDFIGRPFLELPPQ